MGQILCEKGTFLQIWSHIMYYAGKMLGQEYNYISWILQTIDLNSIKII